MEFVIYFLLGLVIYTLLFYILDRFTGQKEPRSLNRILGVMIAIGVIEVVVLRVSGTDALSILALLLAYLVSMFTLNAFYRWLIKNDSQHSSSES